MAMTIRNTATTATSIGGNDIGTPPAVAASETSHVRAAEAMTPTIPTQKLSLHCRP